MIEIDIANNFKGSRPSKYPGVILQLIWQNPSNALHTKGLTIIKTKKILNLIHSTANKDTASSSHAPMSKLER